MGKPRISIGLDARPLVFSVSGISRVISRVILHYPEPRNVEFVLFAHGPCHADYADILRLPNVRWVTGTGWTARIPAVWYLLQLPRLFRRENCTLYWGTQQTVPPGIPRKTPVVLTFYDLVAWLFPESMRRSARLQFYALQRYSIGRAANIISISRQTQEDMIARFGFPEEKARVGYLGYELSRPAGKTDASLVPKGPFGLAVSTLEPRKNYSTLLRAYRAYAEGTKNPVPLVIAGRRGWETPEFFALLETCRAELPSLRVIDNASDALLQALYKKASYFCLASLYEGFGLPLLEALAYGCPAVVSDIGSFREIGGDLVEYAGAEDVGAWTQALTEFSRAARKGGPKRVRFPVSRWSWERTAEVYRDVFSALS